MIRRQKQASVSGMILLFLVLLNVIFIKAGYTKDEKWYWFLIVTVPLLLLLAIVNIRYRRQQASR